MKQLTVEHFSTLLALLRERGFLIIGPKKGAHAIELGEIHSLSDLPAGWSETQSAGRYALEREESATEGVGEGSAPFFLHTVGPHSWKQYLHPPVQCIWRTVDGRAPEPPSEAPAKRVFLGVRSCDARAIAVLDRVLKDDPLYRERRKAVLLIGVDCVRAAESCFCVAADGGPRLENGFDIALTEIFDAGGDRKPRHVFIARSGSEQGEELLRSLNAPAPTEELLAEGTLRIASAAEAMFKRGLSSESFREVPQALATRAEHPQWERVAERCLTCGNCTMVCPTCYCTDGRFTTTLDSGEVELHREWESCFSLNFSALQNGSIRTSAKSRYRHWLTHKWSSWVSQFGEVGCVGCGRCVSWCPAEIDLREELTHLLKEGEPVKAQRR